MQSKDWLWGPRGFCQLPILMRRVSWQQECFWSVWQIDTEERIEASIFTWPREFGGVVFGSRLYGKYNRTSWVVNFGGFVLEGSMVGRTQYRWTVGKPGRDDHERYANFNVEIQWVRSGRVDRCCQEFMMGELHSVGGSICVPESVCWAQVPQILRLRRILRIFDIGLACGDRSTSGRQVSVRCFPMGRQIRAQRANPLLQCNELVIFFAWDSELHWHRVEVVVGDTIGRVVKARIVFRVNGIHLAPEIHEHFMIHKGYGTLRISSRTTSTILSAPWPIAWTSQCTLTWTLRSSEHAAHRL